MKGQTPEEKAVVSYNAGLKHRDKAAKYEQKAIAETNDKKFAKLKKKNTKEYNKAIDDFEKAIKYYPRFYQAHSSLGYALRKVGLVIWCADQHHNAGRQRAFNDMRGIRCVIIRTGCRFAVN